MPCRGRRTAKTPQLVPPPPTSSETFRVKNALTKLKTHEFYPQEDIFCEFYEVKLCKQGFVLRLEPVENTVDVLSSPNLQGFNCNLKPFPKPFEDIARVFAVFVSAANKNASRASKRKLVSKPKACDVDAFPALNKHPKTTVDALPAFNKCLETAVDGLPALNKYAKTAVDGLPALDKYPKTAVDGLSSLEERTKTAVYGILSRKGMATTAVAALSCGFSARFALGYSITQKIKRGIFV